MQKIVLALLFICISFVTNAQKKEKFISWSEDRKLVWEDFKGRPDKSSSFHAQTWGNMAYQFEQINNDEFKFVLSVDFEIMKSWYKKKNASDELLVHEQCHFDLFEVFARIFIKRLEESSALTGKDFSKKTEKIFQTTFKELQKMQKQYDKETDHSNIKEKQDEWTNKIRDMLDENKSFAKREFTFNPSSQ